MVASPPSLVLRPQKMSAIWLLLGCTMFVAIGVWMVRSGDPLGYLCAGFFGLGVPVALAQLLPNSAYLRIEPAGLTFTKLFRRHTVPWQVIDRFFVVSLKQTGLTVHKMVGFNYVPSFDRSRLGRRISSMIADCEAALPDNYGKSPEELAQLLNECLASFTLHATAHADSSRRPGSP